MPIAYGRRTPSKVPRELADLTFLSGLFVEIPDHAMSPKKVAATAEAALGLDIANPLVMKAVTDAAGLLKGRGDQPLSAGATGELGRAHDVLKDYVRELRRQPFSEVELRNLSAQQNQGRTGPDF